MRSMITAKDKYLQFSSMHPYCKSIVAKQCVHEGTVSDSERQIDA